MSIAGIIPYAALFFSLVQLVWGQDWVAVYQYTSQYCSASTLELSHTAVSACTASHYGSCTDLQIAGEWKRFTLYDDGSRSLCFIEFSRDVQGCPQSHIMNQYCLNSYADKAKFLAGQCVLAVVSDRNGTVHTQDQWRYIASAPCETETCPRCAIDHFKSAIQEDCKAEAADKVKAIAEGQLGEALGLHVKSALDASAMQSLGLSARFASALTQACEACLEAIFEAVRSLADESDEACAGAQLCKNLALLPSLELLESAEGMCGAEQVTV